MTSRLNKLSNLLDESPESYYWLGFLLADGHFSNTNRLTVSLSIKDKDHLKKLSDFLECDSNLREYSFEWHDTKYDMVNFSVMDKNTISILKSKYKIESNKTKLPPNLHTLSDTNKFCVMIGFIDGDGSIQYQTNRTDCKISIKCHARWLDNLTFLFGNARLNVAGYAYHCTADNEIIREWKRKIIDLKLPVLQRKWEKIDIEKVSKYRKAKEWQDVAEQLYKDGKSFKEISAILNKKYTTVYQAMVRRNLTKEKSI
jgi:hypothetical protein